MDAFRIMTLFLRSPLVLCTASLLAGIGAGNFQRRPLPRENARETDTALPLSALEQESASTAKGEDSALGNVASGSAFARLPLEEQTASLLRLARKAKESPSLQFLLVKLAAELPTDSLSHILEELAGHKSPETEYAKLVFAERLAAGDPQRVLTLGTEKKDPLVVQEGIHALIKQNAAEAIKAWASLPPGLQSESTARQQPRISAGGSLPEVLSVIKSQPQLLEKIVETKPGGWFLEEVIGSLAAKAATIDTAQALSEMRAAADQILEANPKRSPTLPEIERIKQRDALVARVANQAFSALREESTPLGSGFFNALKDSEKNRWEYGTEAVARFKHAGSETAISFAESQNSKENMSMAATGVWWALASENRGSALQWIESLPPGAFRAGCLKSVMMDAWTQTQSWGDAQVAIDAGSHLLSPASRLEYYSEMLGEMHFAHRDGRSRAEIIAGLPLTPEEKAELERRAAPIKPQ